MTGSFFFKVKVNCMTYNHSAFITNTMNGFVIQQTNFPFVCCIIDDASSDGEQEVIRRFVSENFDLKDVSIAYEKDTDYGHVTFAQHKTNRNCYFAVVYLKENHYSQKKSKAPYLTEWEDTKYIALCEGDDYWTDPLKLQKQVDFLERHPDYSLCCHRFKIYHENTNTWSDDYVGKVFAENPNVSGVVVTNSNNFRTRFTWTLTLCYRKSVADAIVWPNYKIGPRDFNFHYQLLKAGKGWCFSDCMGVYRVNSGGVWSRLPNLERDKFRLKCYEDLYSFHKDDKVVLERYIEWLERFYRESVCSPFRRNKLTRNGIKNLGFYFKHCWKTEGLYIAIKNSARCFGLLIGVVKD